MEPDVNLHCVLFALRREAAPFLRVCRPQRRFRGAPCWAARCGPVLVLETGVGRERTEAALNWLQNDASLRPRLIVSAGFSGALNEALHVGDVLLATEVLDLHGNRWPTTWSPVADASGSDRTAGRAEIAILPVSDMAPARQTLALSQTFLPLNRLCK